MIEAAEAAASGSIKLAAGSTFGPALPPAG